MKQLLITSLLFVSPVFLACQINNYTISFDNAEHHEALVTGLFDDIETDTLELRMSRTSPGRYALHEFAKNVYNFKATDGKGTPLKILRPDPYRWQVAQHDGTVNISYTLFANRGDGTYSQIDETHAHLNIPATFMYAPELSERKIAVTFHVREDLNWKVASQLPLVSGTNYSAPDLQYFMDSPVEISDFALRSFQVDSDGREQTVQFVLHHDGTEEELNNYFEKVKKIVLAEKEVYGELPQFDYGRYTFLACYVPNASGDGMEHRNSTVLTSTRSLAEGGMDGNIGTVSHEFFHAWNVERIRPSSLEPFDFTEANMSGALWFAEGFTSYYTGLILCRAGLVSPEQYIEGLTGIFNYVWNSPARQFFNPIEMSYQAPFVDAATSVDPVNRENTFISYYSYGSMLGLALDLSLRQKNLDLDGYMKLIWDTYGKTAVPYTVADLHKSLNTYAGKVFGDSFFNKYIYQSEMPDYEALFKSVGVDLIRNPDVPYFGASVSSEANGTYIIEGNSILGSPAYEADLDKGDILIAMNGSSFEKQGPFSEYIRQFKVGDTLTISFKRFEKEGTTTLVLGTSPDYTIQHLEKNGNMPSAEVLTKRKEWLKIP